MKETWDYDDDEDNPFESILSSLAPTSQNLLDLPQFTRPEDQGDDEL